MKLSKAKIKAIDLKGLSSLITNEESKGFFMLEEGKEHYKLLAYISSVNDGIIISDIGTFRGCSALALSYNTNNTIKSYDVSDSKTLKGRRGNIKFIISEKKSFSKDILESQIIFVDTLHDGVLEKEIFDFLKESEWKGVLIFDDIHLNDQMKSFWESIEDEKEDLTNIGHWSGTGLINFK